nr:hypothetical protein FVER53263_03184 [Fusarium verticillioides]
MTYGLLCIDIDNSASNSENLSILKLTNCQTVHDERGSASQKQVRHSLSLTYACWLPEPSVAAKTFFPLPNNSHGLRLPFEGLFPPCFPLSSWRATGPRITVIMPAKEGKTTSDYPQWYWSHLRVETDGY